jgi:hypothetical protein
MSIAPSNDRCRRLRCTAAVGRSRPVKRNNDLTPAARSDLGYYKLTGPPPPTLTRKKACTGGRVRLNARLGRGVISMPGANAINDEGEQ